MRGPLDVLKESWECGKKSNESVVSHIIQIREMMDKMTELVRENLEHSRDSQKRWYDQHAREREFKEGEEVCVLLPTQTNKLFAQWHGPYKVVKRIGKVTYQIDTHKRNNRYRTFHINILRKWNSPSVTVGFAEELPETKEADDIPCWKDNNGSDLKFNCGEELTASMKNEVSRLVGEKFSDVFADEPGKTDVIEHDIRVKNSMPVRQPAYRIPYAYKEEVRKELREMLEAGVIEESKSEWASPIVLVRKKDKTLRLCVDYRRLNTVSEFEAYPMPRIEDLLDSLGKARFLTTLDLAKGYWQVPVQESARDKTAFITPFGLFQFTRMPFGLSGAPATFQRLMDRVLRGHENYAAAYLDDLVIHSETWEDHLEHISAVLMALREAGLTAKLRKCQFAKAECVYLGHRVGQGKIVPEQSKIDAVQRFPVPTTKKHVRVFLGLAGYYRKFIQNFSEITAPLSDLVKRNRPNQIQWNEKLDQAFKKVKELLCKKPVLRSPDFQRPFLLQTDASEQGIGVVLSQREEDGTDYPVAYFSKKLLPREQRYSTVEKECLAIRLGVQAFRVYLLGRPFQIQTDHRSLEWLDRLKTDNARLARWSLALQPYQFSVVH